MLPIQECSVCLEDLNHAVFLPNCGHKFHELCVSALPSKECPRCREPFTIWRIDHDYNSLIENIQQVWQNRLQESVPRPKPEPSAPPPSADRVVSSGNVVSLPIELSRRDLERGGEHSHKELSRLEFVNAVATFAAREIVFKGPNNQPKNNDNVHCNCSLQSLINGLMGISSESYSFFDDHIGMMKNSKFLEGSNYIKLDIAHNLHFSIINCIYKNSLTPLTPNNDKNFKVSQYIMDYMSEKNYELPGWYYARNFPFPEYLDVFELSVILNVCILMENRIFGWNFNDLYRLWVPNPGYPKEMRQYTECKKNIFHILSLGVKHLPNLRDFLFCVLKRLIGEDFDRTVKDNEGKKPLSRLSRKQRKEVDEGINRLSKRKSGFDSDSDSDVDINCSIS